MIKKSRASPQLLLTVMFLTGLVVVGVGISRAGSLELRAAAGSNYVDIEWSDGESAETYEIYRDITETVTVSSGTLIEAVYGTETAYRDTSVEGGIIYHYLVRAVSGSQFRDSNIASAEPFGKHPHGNYDISVEACSDCHTAHTAEAPQLLSGAGVNQTCYQCHSTTALAYDVESEFSKIGSAHPVADQTCSLCHNGHLDPVTDPSLLERTVSGAVYRGGGNEYCLGCHNNIDSIFEMDGGHNSAAVTPENTKIACSGCHEPHGSDLEWLLKQRPLNSTQGTSSAGKDYCLTCHENSGSGIDNEWNGEQPYNRGHGDTAYDCSTCHEPHGTSYEDYLLRSYDQDYDIYRTESYSSSDYNTCYSCHYSSNVMGGGDFYDAVNGRNLHRKHSVENNAVCKECHRSHGAIPSENPELKHLVGFPASTVTGTVYNSIPYFREQSVGGYCALSCHGVEHYEDTSVYQYVYDEQTVTETVY